MIKYFLLFSGILTIGLFFCFSSTLALTTTTDQLGVSGTGTGLKVDTFDVPGFVMKVINILVFLFAVIAVGALVYGGFRYITSGGNDTQKETAKKVITYAIIGIIIIVAALAIVTIIQGIITAEIV